MAALDFPSAPTVGQTFAAPNGVVYRWNGTLWLAVSVTSPGGDFCAVQTSGFAAVTTSWTTLLLNQILSGNSGGWYNSANGRFTPPAGRYYISCSMSAQNTTTAREYVKLRKNGVDIAFVEDTTGGASLGANPNLEIVVDANGTDWFDVQVSHSAGTTTVTFQSFMAFPISGVKGPPGDNIYNEQVLAAAANQIAVTIPANAKKVEIEFAATVTTAVDKLISLQYMQGAIPLASAYAVQSVWGAGGSAAAQLVSAGTGIGLITGVAASGSIKLFNNNNVPHFVANSYGSTTGAYLALQAIGNNSALYSSITGMRLTIPSDTFRAGSYMRCFATT